MENVIETKCLTNNKLKEYYETQLTLKYQGYIQLSGEKIDLFTDFRELPAWSKEGFIFEAAFYDGKNSILIREINDKWVVTEVNRSKIETCEKYNITKQNYFNTIKGQPKVKMDQIWEAKEDKLCNWFEVFEPICQVFVGFEGGEK